MQWKRKNKRHERRVREVGEETRKWGIDGGRQREREREREGGVVGGG